MQMHWQENKREIGNFEVDFAEQMCVPKIFRFDGAAKKGNANEEEKNVFFADNLLCVIFYAISVAMHAKCVCVFGKTIYFIIIIIMSGAFRNMQNHINQTLNT